jgi:hypothetical protein
MNHRPEFPGKHQSLTTCTATCIDDNAKLVFRNKTQDVQCMFVVSRAEFLEAAEEQGNWIRGGHRLFHAWKNLVSCRTEHAPRRTTEMEIKEGETACSAERQSRNQKGGQAAGLSDQASRRVSTRQARVPAPRSWSRKSSRAAKNSTECNTSGLPPFHPAKPEAGLRKAGHSSSTQYKWTFIYCQEGK